MHVSRVKINNSVSTFPSRAFVYKQTTVIFFTDVIKKFVLIRLVQEITATMSVWAILPSLMFLASLVCLCTAKCPHGTYMDSYKGCVR